MRATKVKLVPESEQYAIVHAREIARAWGVKILVVRTGEKFHCALDGMRMPEGGEIVGFTNQTGDLFVYANASVAA